MPTVLITRAEPDASQLAAALSARGYDSLIFPLLTIKTLPPSPISPYIKGIILTSRNAVYALKNVLHADTLPIFTVNDATAQAVAELGYKNIHNAASNAAELAVLVQHHFEGQHATLLYLRGQHIAYDIKAALLRRDIYVDEVTVYSADACAAFSPEIIAAFNSGQLNAVLFYSERTVDIFLSCAKKAQVEQCVSTVDCIAGNAAIARMASLLPWRSIHNAEGFSFEKMADSLDNACASR